MWGRIREAQHAIERMLHPHFRHLRHSSPNSSRFFTNQIAKTLVSGIPLTLSFDEDQLPFPHGKGQTGYLFVVLTGTAKLSIFGTVWI
jgi:hypothetical protein